MALTMTRPFTSALLCLLLAALLAACAPDTKREQQYWESHQQAVTEHSARWPGFKGVLDGIIRVAGPAWQKATKMSDEAKQAKTMKAINKAIKMIKPMCRLPSKAEQNHCTKLAMSF